MYKKWPTKAELIAEALRRHAEGSGPEHVPDTGSLRGDLLLHVERLAESVSGSGPSLLYLLEAVRDDSTLRDRIRAQIENAGAVVGEIIGRRAVARNESRPGVDAAAVLQVAVAQLLTHALLHGTTPGPEFQHRLVDRVLLPLLS